MIEAIVFLSFGAFLMVLVSCGMLIYEKAEKQRIRNELDKLELEKKKR